MSARFRDNDEGQASSKRMRSSGSGMRGYIERGGDDNSGSSSSSSRDYTHRKKPNGYGAKAMFGYNEGTGDFDRRRDPNNPSDGSLPPAPNEALFLGDALKKQTNGVTGQIHSAGIHDPTSKQSSINQTFIYSKTLYEERAQTLPKEALAPLGSRKDLMLMAHAWLFSSRGKSGARANVRKKGFGNGEVEVFDCVNGLDRREKIVFEGQSVTQTDPTDQHARADCAGTKAGTVTGTNTGPFTMPPGETAGFLNTPYAVNDNGTPKPGIQIKGVPPGKFVPMMIPMNELATPAIYARAIEAADKSGWVLNGGGDFKDEWMDARQKMRTVVLNSPLEDDGLTAWDDIVPVDIYLAWLMLQRHWDAAAAQLVEEAQWRMAAVAYHSELMQEEKFDWITTPPGHPKHASRMELRKTQCLANMQSWISSHAAGKVLTASPPGTQIDLMLGYFTF